MYKKLIFGVAVISAVSISPAQVGINTTDPKAQLEISVEDPAAPGITDGLLIPRISNFPALQPSSDQNGMLVFLTTTRNEYVPGFYFWNATSSKWEAISGKATSDFFKNGTTSPSTNPSDPIYRRGNVSIGGEFQNIKLKVAITTLDDILTRTALEVENASPSPKNVTYGIVSLNKSVTADKKYGIKNTVSGDGTGIHYGILNETNQNTNEEIYGIYNDVGKTFGSTKNHYGIYNKIGTTQGTGFVYGLYSVAYGNDPKKLYAGYFAGRVGIGATPAEEYILPDVRGSQDQVLVSDGAGMVTWKNPVYKTYSSTTSSTGSYQIADDTYTLRINNQVSSIAIPDAAVHKGRILFLLSWPGNSEKTFDFVNGNDLFDIATNSTVSSIKAGESFMIQSAGNRWILLMK